ncbi:MAG: type II toxin-antitoxin system RelE/ParE family toxin [Armatimonadota bacterium]
MEQYIADQSLRDQKKIVARIMAMAERGPHRNREKYGDLGDGIYTLKPDSQHRIPFFYGERGVIVLTHGFFKVQDEAPPAEVARAKQLNELYEQFVQSQ